MVGPSSHLGTQFSSRDQVPISGSSSHLWTVLLSRDRVPISGPSSHLGTVFPPQCGWLWGLGHYAPLQQHLTMACWQDAHIKTAELMVRMHLLQGGLAAITAAAHGSSGSVSAGSER